MLNDYPHRRFNPLLNEWVLVSPHRTKRPWQGQQDEPDTGTLPEYDAGCYLCPGNVRANGEKNPDYSDIFVFTNDFAALLPEGPESFGEREPLLRAEPETGICRVICYSPRHDLSMARMSPEQARKVVDVWGREYESLGAWEDIGHVQIFENRGTIMECSNPHPHGQIWATSTVPTIPAAEHDCQKEYQRKHGSCMLCDYLERELALDERIVLQNDSFVVLVPFWAVWPFEVMILPREHMTSIAAMNEGMRSDLAEIMVRLGIRYDNLFKTSFPYSMGLHQQPTDGRDHSQWHFHMHYYPPLLRSASVRKFMVGFEMMAMPQRDITPEQSAARLRELSETHYLGGE